MVSILFPSKSLFIKSIVSSFFKVSFILFSSSAYCLMSKDEPLPPLSSRNMNRSPAWWLWSPHSLTSSMTSCKAWKETGDGNLSSHSVSETLYSTTVSVVLVAMLAVITRETSLSLIISPTSRVRQSVCPLVKWDLKQLLTWGLQRCRVIMFVKCCVSEMPGKIPNPLR